jgi:predicted SnoaL-like aldol condensation-catalyzing enzyme
MSPITMSKIESGVRAVIDFNDAFNRHDVDGMMKLTSEDTVFENTSPAPDGTAYKGKKTVTKFWREFFRESPQAHIDIEEIFGMGFHVTMRWKYTWGDGHVRGVDVFKLKDGRSAKSCLTLKVEKFTGETNGNSPRCQIVDRIGLPRASCHD